MNFYHPDSIACGRAEVAAEEAFSDAADEITAEIGGIVGVIRDALDDAVVSTAHLHDVEEPDEIEQLTLIAWQAVLAEAKRRVGEAA